MIARFFANRSCRFSYYAIIVLRWVALAIVITAAVCALAGCSTTVYGADSRPQFRTYANIEGLEFTGPGTSFRAQRINHSTPTRAAGAAVGGTIREVGAAGTALGLGAEGF